MGQEVIFASAILFFIGLSLSLTVISIRQRKQSKLLKNLSSSEKITQIDSLSNFGVAKKGVDLVTKCPACAEWIKLEANVCKFCKKDVSSLTQEIREKIAEHRVLQLKLASELKQERQERNQRLIRDRRLQAISMLLVLSVTFLVVKGAADNRTRKETMLAIAAGDPVAVNKWKVLLRDCGIGYYTTYRDSSNDYNLELYLDAPLKEYDWSKTVGKEINCFSTKALGFRISDKVDWEGDISELLEISEELQISLSAYGSSSKIYISFDK